MSGRVSLPPELLPTLPPGVKPSYPVEVDRSHPLARRLVGFWLGGESKNYATGVVNDAIGSDITIEATPNGIGWANTGDNTASRFDLGSLPSSDPLSLAGNTECAIFTDFSWDTRTLSNAYPRLIDKSDGGSGANGWGLYYDTGIDEFVFSIDGNTSLTSGNIFRPSTLTRFKLGLSVNLAGDAPDMWFYDDGIEFDRDSTSETAFPSTTTNGALLNWNHSTDREWPWPTRVIAVWDRALTDVEHLSLAQNPYSFLKPAVPMTQIITPASTPDDRVWIV